MKTEHFNQVVESRTEKIKSVLAKKATEYASAKDRLHNFKTAALFDGITPERALWGMMLKHLTSVRDMVHGLEQEPFDHCPDAALWDEKLGDSINYLVLLEGLIAERVHLNFDRKVQNEEHEQKPMAWLPEGTKFVDSLGPWYAPPVMTGCSVMVECSACGKLNPRGVMCRCYW
jgi:hypothetical protein